MTIRNNPDYFTKQAPDCGCILAFPRDLQLLLKNHKLITLVPCQHHLYFVEMIGQGLTIRPVRVSQVEELYNKVEGTERTIEQGEYRFVFKLVCLK